MPKEGYWAIRTYISGNVGEKIKYWVPGARPTKSAGRMKSEINKIKSNVNGAERRLARIINANFRPGDYLVGLDYSASGLKALRPRARQIGKNRVIEAKNYDNAAAERMECLRMSAEQEAVNCLRRVRRTCAAAGIDVRCVTVTSDMDGDTGESVRVHHHLIINAEALDVLREKWTAGGVTFDALSAQADFTPVAAYLIRQVRHIPDAKKYRCTRNLSQPEPVDRVAVNGSEIRVPRGAAVLYRGAFIPGRPQYIRYILPHRKKTEGEKDDE